MKMGALRAAQTTQVPFVMVAVGFKGYRKLRSWDAFQVPYPYTRARVVFSIPRLIDPAADGDALEAIRFEMEMEMRRMHEKAAKLVSA